MKLLSAGQPAPDFSLPDQDGGTVTLSRLLEGGPVVLFFYPAAMSSGCTMEACRFRDLGAEFAAAGGLRVGISMDAVDTQSRWASEQALDYPLLSDGDGAVAAAYGVRRRFVPLVRRATFVIDTDRRILDVVSSEVNMTVHADRALEALAGRAAQAPG